MTYLISDIYQILFIASIVYLIYILSNFIIKFYGRVKLGQSTRIILSNMERIILWISITTFFSYIL